MDPDSGRDERGRLRPGHSGNPHGRPPGRTSTALERLISAAVAAGATIQIVLRPDGRTADLPTKLRAEL
jgi:hypothetical protein